MNPTRKTRPAPAPRRSGKPAPQVPAEKEFADATEFLDYWFSQACPLEGRHPTEVIAARAALDQSPQLVQTVRRQLKRLLADDRFPAWARLVRRTMTEAEVRRWLVEVIRGLTAGLKIRNTTGRVESSAPFDLSLPPATRRRGWRERRDQRRRDPT